MPKPAADGIDVVPLWVETLISTEDIEVPPGERDLHAATKKATIRRNE